MRGEKVSFIVSPSLPEWADQFEIRAIGPHGKISIHRAMLSNGDAVAAEPPKKPTKKKTGRR